MSPLALYIEHALFHKPGFSPSSQPEIYLYPPSPPNDQTFTSLHSATILDKGETNRILIYFGSFNPPHRGHLHLLKHVFTRGRPGLHVKAAIIIPLSDKSVARKVKCKDGNFMFGMDENGLLWKRDLCFPPWAWVFNQKTTSFGKFWQRLEQLTDKDGVSIELVPLYGPEFVSPEEPPDPIYGCKTMIISDAARAADFQRSSGRLRDFMGCTRWRGVDVNESNLRRRGEARARRALRDFKIICPQEARNMLKDDHAYVEEFAEAYVTKTKEEIKALVVCERHMGQQTLTLRFVKCDDLSPRAYYNDISSTALRKLMHKKKGDQLKEAIDWMALSGDLLWQFRSSWIDKARSGTGCCINFQNAVEEFESSKKPPHFDHPPLLKELARLKVPEKSPSVEEPPSLVEHPMSQEDSPTIEEPQSLEESPLNNNIKRKKKKKKRKFSETGLEDEFENEDELIGFIHYFPEYASLKSELAPFFQYAF